MPRDTCSDSVVRNRKNARSADERTYASVYVSEDCASYQRNKVSSRIGGPWYSPRHSAISSGDVEGRPYVNKTCHSHHKKGDCRTNE